MFDRARIEALVAKYSERVPRYTSYPTARNFKSDVNATVYADWLADLAATEPVSAYVHIPFCRSLCWYCGCNMSVVRSHGPIADYLERLIHEFRLVRQHVGKQLTMTALHLGGGTPNALLPNDLERIFVELRNQFQIGADAEIGAEIDPRILTSDWVKAAADNGINRVSLGVQDLDPMVQQTVNRMQPLAETARAADDFRRAGVNSINFDLMYGLPYKTKASVARTVSKIITLAPDRVALFGYAHVPWMKPAQRLLPELALPTPRDRFEQQDVAAQLLVEAGYRRIGLDHFAKAGDALASGTVKRNFQGYTTDTARSLLGFGASAIGRLPQGYVQNAPRVPDWRKCVTSDQLATVRGVSISEEDTFRSEIISRLMCDLYVDTDEVAHHTGFATASAVLDVARLREVEADGLVKIDGPRVQVTEIGRPFVRSICAAVDTYLDRSPGRHSSGV